MTLRTDAARTIRRHTSVRWGASIGALAVFGAFTTAALTGATGRDRGDDRVAVSPVPAPMIGFATADFSITGGPEFVRASEGLRCGDPAPVQHNVEHGLKLEVIPGHPPADGAVRTKDALLPSVDVVLSPVTNDVRGTVSTSGIDILVVQNGIIRGVLAGEGTELAVALSTTNPADWPRLLVAERTHCPSATGSEPSGLHPGSYQLVAIGRVFSTPESVALSQAMGSASSIQFLDAGIQADPHAIYLPGSYDCEQLLTTGSVSRACLPDLTDSAAVDAKTGTVSVVYKTKGLVDEFSTVLVSEPLTASLASSDVLSPPDWEPWAGIGPFDTLESFACGTVGLGMAVGVDAKFHVAAIYESAPHGLKQMGGTFPGTVFAPDAPGGSTVELLPGARLVFLSDYELVSPIGMSTTNISTVVAWAPLTASGPVTADRFTGPQDAEFTNDPATLCPEVEPGAALGNLHAAFVGQWRVSTPDGTVTTNDSATDPSVIYGYVR